MTRRARTGLMDDEVRKKIDRLMAGMQCPKGFSCSERGFARLCKAKDIGLESFLVCLEERPEACPFALSFGDSYLCQCSLRVYLSKELKK